MRVIIVIVALLISTGDLFAASGSVDRHEKPFLSFKELPEFRISRGEVLYKRYCLFCHGESGAGDGMNAYNLPIKPASFLNDEFRAKPAHKVEKIVMDGGEVFGRDKAMPPFRKTLSRKNITDLIIYLQNLNFSSIEEESDEL
jgi:mono/diheme cytochrome c family protein